MSNDADFGPFGSPVDYNDDTDLAEAWAYLDGTIAYEHGEPRDTNPFPASHRHYQAWLDGWMTACEERG